MNIKVIKGKLIIDVAIELPIRIMGSGAELNSEYVDQDLMSGDRQLMKKLKIDYLVLCGFLLKIPEFIISEYKNKIINYIILN